MGSLHDLLTREGFRGEKTTKTQKKVNFSDRRAPDESITLPIYICHDRKSFEFSKPKPPKTSSKDGSSVYSSKRGGSGSGNSGARKSYEPAIDEVAVRAVVSILSGYIGRYSKDKTFRDSVRKKCYSCLARRRKDFVDNGVFANMELGMESVEKLVENQGARTEFRTKSLLNAIGFLSTVNSLNSKDLKGRTHNAHLSACAQLYLSIIYKIDRNDRLSARHLLQVFCDSPFLARTYLLPELWEHFFLPHLLHLKIWYEEQVEILSESDPTEGGNKLRVLEKIYGDQMDKGTVLFAVYYKEWLKTGAQAPPLPSVPLPRATPRRRASESFTSHSSINKILYRTVFGPSMSSKSLDLDDSSRAALIGTWDLEDDEKELLDEHASKQQDFESGVSAHGRLLSQISRQSKQETRKSSDYKRFLPCHSDETTRSVHNGNTFNNGTVKKIVNPNAVPSSDLSKAVATICSSNSLADCEMAIRVMSKSWLDLKDFEAILSKPPVIESMLEILFTSNNDEISELIISLLAEFITRSDTNGQIILNFDSQLKGFVTLMGSSSLFLKASALLYLVKPKAKHMVSMDWVPLVLRVLEFGDQMQTLFTIRFSPKMAAYYLLDQLVSNFDEDKNGENARQVISLGGLSLLVWRMDIGDLEEKGKAASIVYCCVRAEGTCRHYVAENLNVNSVLSLLVQSKEIDHGYTASALLAELLCLNRVAERNKLLNGLISGWGSLNTMHLFLIYLQRAQPDERPLVAAVILHLDLLGDPLKSSVIREEAIDAMIEALDWQTYNETVQERAAKALMMLGGRFSYTGEPEVEQWLLKEAGFDDGLGDPFLGRDIVVDRYKHMSEEDEAIERWQRKLAVLFLKNEKFLAALSGCVENAIPRLARSCLVTIAWTSRHLQSAGDEDLRSTACSVLVARLVGSVSHDKAVEERVLASFSLLGLVQSSGVAGENVVKLLQQEKGRLAQLRDLSQVTWTAAKLLSSVS